MKARHAWLQKHASPIANGGEFHWYPADGDRELRASCVERQRGVDAPAVLWELAPGRVAWAQPFAATAPHDKRRYSGLVLTIVETEGEADSESAAMLLDQLVAPPAEPWTEATATTPRQAASAPRPSERDVAAVARALLTGGAARVADPLDPSLAAHVASVERLLPARVTTKLRRGAWLRAEQTAAVSTPPDRIAELLASAWRDPSSSSAGGWKLVVELAAARDQTLDEIGAELVVIDAIGALTDEERSALPGSPDFVGVLHAWGRGHFDRCPTAGSLTNRLADAVALRVLAHLVEGSDAGAAVAEARWYALLPAARRTTLLDAVVERAGSLRPLVIRG